MAKTAGEIRMQTKINNYVGFLKNKPILYGYMMMNGIQKIGSFRPEYNRYTNNIQYQYYTEAGNKGKGGFSMQRAFDLYKRGGLGLNPSKGKRKNYF